MINLEQRVNKPWSSEWTRFNDNTRSALYRKQFIEKNGGEFKHNGKWYKWYPPTKSKTALQIPVIESKVTNKKEKNSHVNPYSVFESRLSEKKSVANQKGLYIITDPEGNETEIENFSKFCRDHKLNKSAMYEVARGQRKHHKKYTCRKKEY